MLHATLKGLLARKRRLALTVISIVLGVGFVAGTFVLTDTMNKAFDQLFTDAAAGSDVVVRAEQAFAPSATGPGSGAIEERDPVPDTLLPTVESVPGVASASGDVSGSAQVVDPATGDPIGGVGPPTIGTNWTDTNPTVQIREGAAPSAADDVVIDAATATRYDLTVGQDVKILFQGPPEEFTISGILGFGDADNLGGATLAAFTLPTAQRVLDKEGEFDSISVLGDEGTDPGQLRAAIQDVLPPKVEAVTSTSVADEQSDQLKEGLGFFRIALLVFAFIALFVGSFQIFNTFSIIVAQRAKELALLRAVGASRRQVLTSVIIEALVLGLVAAVIGIVAGVGIAVLLKALLSGFGIDLPSTSLQLKPRTIVVSLIIGVVVTTVASVLPARRAARVAPIEALRDSQDAGADHLGRRSVIGVIVTALGLAFLGYGLFGEPDNAGLLIGGGAAVIFIGIAILSPLAARPLSGAIGRPVRGLSMAARLGRENAMRNPRRTAATSSALMIGLGLIAMVSILSASLKASFDAALQDTLRADLVLTSSSFLPFSQEVAARTADVDGVEAVSAFRQGGFKVNDSDAAMTGVDPATIETVANLGPSEGAIASLDGGDVLVYDQTMEDNGWAVGDELPSAFATIGDDPLTIGGTFDDNRLVGDYVVSLDTFDELFRAQLDTFVFVKVADGADTAAVRGDVEQATAEFGNIEVQDQAAFRDQQAGFVNQLLGLVTAMLFLAVVIALFGIANTLSLSIFERTRELGLLRAVGMGRTQVKRMIRWESVIIAILGALFGIAIGIFFGWALQQALAPEGITEFVLPVGQLVFFLILAALAGVVVALLPARRAAKLNVLEAISYE
ncbi:MAG TPA: FtsX-like permease family protein [Actinomycetota bacterium]|nr:FtsX-like permease family protein [Actinomycetota bacterium]